MIRPRYQRWVFDNVRLKIKNLFIDANGNYIQNQDEPLMGMDQLPLGDYVVSVNTVWFHDLNNSGIYDEGDEIFDSYTSAPQIFTLTDEPVIYHVKPEYVSKYYGYPWKVGNVIIKGVNFGNTQGSRTLHVGGRVWSAGDPNILVWRDNKIKFKFPRGADSDHLGIKVREGSSTSNRVVIETPIYEGD